MYKVKTFLQLLLNGDNPLPDQMNAFLKDNPKVVPISISHGVSTTDGGIVIGIHAMLLYKEEE